MDPGESTDFLYLLLEGIVGVAIGEDGEAKAPLVEGRTFFLEAMLSGAT